MKRGATRYMCVHIGGKENEKIFCFIKIKHANAINSRKPSKAFQ